MSLRSLAIIPKWTFIMIITLRVLNPSASSTVTMLWADRQGSFCPSTGCSWYIQHRTVTFSPLAQAVTAEQYLFNATINAYFFISKFWFEISDNAAPIPFIVIMGPSGFVIEQDSLFVDFKRTNTDRTFSHHFRVFELLWRYVSHEAVEAYRHL
ncbi:hypothetical protein BT96DRAFT_1008951 [Gymnopus androsaceus JB14]|uniref:Uncharacterized protein n=1 Tax=Gymnopus androsaceus JB14 TaxID=1447944 RepID=A0A6A4GDK1_9AGAR|nr:hypothetical protein BT96DRAFT_1008951 [Gymnopus androsaceus JB14]